MYECTKTLSCCGVCHFGYFLEDGHKCKSKFLPRKVREKTLYEKFLDYWKFKKSRDRHRVINKKKNYAKYYKGN